MVIAFQREKISAEYSKLLFPFWRVRAVPYCGGRLGMEKSSSFNNISDVVKGDPSPMWLRRNQEEDEEGAVKRAIKESEIFVS